MVKHTHRDDPCVGGLLTQPAYCSSSRLPPVAIVLFGCVYSIHTHSPTVVTACAHCICLLQKSIDPRWNECSKVQHVCGAVLWLSFQPGWCSNTPPHAWYLVILAKSVATPKVHVFMAHKKHKCLYVPVAYECFLYPCYFQLIYTVAPSRGSRVDQHVTTENHLILMLSQSVLLY